MSPDTTDKDIINAENKALEGRASTTGVSVGNISYRVYLTGQLINQKMSDGANAKGGINRVFHSDEGGRPFVDEVDVAVAFTPEGEAYYIKDAKTEENGEALKNFSLFCISNGYAVIINKGWSKALKDIQISWL